MEHPHPIRRMVLLFLIVVFVFVATNLLYFWSAIRPSKITSRITPADLGLEFETVSFVTKDNLTLRGWFIPRQGGELSLQEHNQKTKTIVLLHGYPADKGNILPALAFLHRTDNLFLFDFRSFGESDGRYSTAGAKEKEDLLAALRFLRSRGIEEVGVWGLSMGGAVALMTAPEAPEIKAIVSESSYARLDLMVVGFYRPLTRVLAKLLFGINLHEVAPGESVKDLSLPILIIHSKDDQVIPFRHALLLETALRHNPRAEFWFTEGYAHGQFEEDYRARIENFFKGNF